MSIAIRLRSSLLRKGTEKVLSGDWVGPSLKWPIFSPLNPSTQSPQARLHRVQGLYQPFVLRAEKSEEETEEVEKKEPEEVPRSRRSGEVSSGPERADGGFGDPASYGMGSGAGGPNGGGKRPKGNPSLKNPSSIPKPDMSGFRRNPDGYFATYANIPISANHTSVINSNKAILGEEEYIPYCSDIYSQYLSEAKNTSEDAQVHESKIAGGEGEGSHQYTLFLAQIQETKVTTPSEPSAKPIKETKIWKTWMSISQLNLEDSEPILPTPTPKKARTPFDSNSAYRPLRNGNTGIMASVFPQYRSNNSH